MYLVVTSYGIYVDEYGATVMAYAGFHVLPIAANDD